MALIPCPHCGKEISSYAKRCPGCGNELTQSVDTIENEVVCPECGTHYGINVASCPNCGEPQKQTEPAILSNPTDRPVSKQIDGNQLVAEYGNLLKVHADEFDDGIEIICRNSMTGNPELDAICEKNDVEGPHVTFHYSSTTDYSIWYSDVLLRSIIERDHLEALADRVSSPCKGMIINIDDNEKIKLTVTEKSGGDSDDELLVFFELTQEQFLKCCNAHKLEFRIFKEDAPEPIIIRGSAEDEELLIASIRAIYNITVREIFPNAKLKLQSLIEKKEAKKKQIEKAKKEAEDKKAQSFSNKKTTGIVMMVIGGFMFIISLFLYEYMTALVLLLGGGLTLVFVGLAVFIYNGYREAGVSKEEAMNILTDEFSKIH